MLDERDLEAIERIVAKSIDERVTKSESMILSEIDRIHGYTKRDMERLEKKIDDLSQLQAAYKLENDTFKLVMSMVEQLSERVEKLENRA